MSDFDDIELVDPQDHQSEGEDDWDMVDAYEADNNEALESIDEGWMTMNSRGIIKVTSIDTKAATREPTIAKPGKVNLTSSEHPGSDAKAEVKRDAEKIAIIAKKSAHDRNMKLTEPKTQGPGQASSSKKLPWPTTPEDVRALVPAAGIHFLELEAKLSSHCADGSRRPKSVRDLVALMKQVANLSKTGILTPKS